MTKHAVVLAIALAAALAWPCAGEAAEVKKPGNSACDAFGRGSPEYRQCEQAQRTQARQARQACAQFAKGSPEHRACLAQRLPPKTG